MIRGVYARLPSWVTEVSNSEVCPCEKDSLVESVVEEDERDDSVRGSGLLVERILCRASGL